MRNIDKAEADRAAAAARRNVAARRDLVYAQTMFSYTQMTAPFDGVVTRRTIDTGHYVHPAAGETAAPLLVVARMDTVRVFLDVPETEAELVNCGPVNADPATVTVQALHNRSFDGTVTRTGWSLDESNRSLRVEVDLPNEKGTLRPGMYATVRIQLEQHPNVLTLPAAAIVRADQRRFAALLKTTRSSAGRWNSA